MDNETVTIDKAMYTTIKCLVVALMDKYCPNKEFILTREHRGKLIGRLSVNVYAETLDNLDDKYWIE